MLTERTTAVSSVSCFVRERPRTFGNWRVVIGQVQITTSQLGFQLVQRILMVFMPTKYQPDYSFVRNVPIKRVHLFTAIQTLCLVVLWVVKSIKSISIAFPLMVSLYNMIYHLRDDVQLKLYLY